MKNPVKRTNRDFNEDEVLFLGDKDEVYFFYKEKPDSDFMLGILNSEIKDHSSTEVNFDDYNEESFKSFNINPESELHKFLKTTLPKGQEPRPVLITVDERISIVFTAVYKEDDKTDSEARSIFFYDVDARKETIRIPDGVVFVKHDQQTNEVVYLARDAEDEPATSLIKHIKTSRLPKLDPNGDIHVCRTDEITKKCNLIFDEESTSLQKHHFNVN